MEYRLNNFYVNTKGTRIEAGDELTLDMVLVDTFGVPLILIKEDPEDPEELIRRDLRWVISERISGTVLTYSSEPNVEVIDDSKAQVRLYVGNGTLILPRNYSHRLYYKWPEEPESSYKLIARGIILSAGLAIRSFG